MSTSPSLSRTDREHMDAIRAAASTLTEAVRAAIRDGLDISIDAIDTQSLGEKGRSPVITGSARRTTFLAKF